MHISMKFYLGKHPCDHHPDQDIEQLQPMAASLESLHHSPAPQGSHCSDFYQ